MANIHQVQMSDVLANLPQLVPWDVSLIIGHQVDLLVVCAGFEDRATAIAKKLKGVTINNLLMIQYPTNESDNEKSFGTLEELDPSDKQIIKYDRQTFLKDFRSSLEELKQPLSRILVDISAMASYVLPRVFSAIWEVLPTSNLQIFYAEAEEYHPTLGDWEDFYKRVENPIDDLSIAESYEQIYFQSRDVDQTYECDVFPGDNQGALATELVAIPSFSLLRMKSMTVYARNQYNVTPSEIFWYLGLPPDSQKNGWRYDAIAKLLNVRNSGRAISTRDYRDIFRNLDETWLDLSRKERHLIIAGMGSKMQNLGVFLFLKMHPECGLLHCEPTEFIADRYTAGIGPCWSLNFEKIEDVQKVLASLRKLSFRW